jgi:prephenate dehydrogenase
MMTLGIIGTGLIGSSIGLRARENGYAVLGFDTDACAAEEAVRCGAIDAIVIAAHTMGCIAEIERLRAAPPARAKLIIDVSSVKAPIVAAACGLRNFVPTHPMAGRECSGPSAATRDLFEGRTWIYVPSGDPELDWRAVEFIGGLGATPVEVDGEEHDRIVAFTSHLPQIFANCFAARAKALPCHLEVSKGGGGIEAFIGPVARELMRLSNSSEAMWRDVIAANQRNISRELRAMADALEAAACGVHS